MCRKLFVLITIIFIPLLFISPIFAKDKKIKTIKLPCVYSQLENSNEGNSNLLIEGKWKDEPFGYCPGLTIGTDGCGITCLAMIYDYHAKSRDRGWCEWNPKDLNYEMKMNQKYGQCKEKGVPKYGVCCIAWELINDNQKKKIKSLNPYCFYKGAHGPTTDYNFAKIIRRELKRKNPVLAQVNGTAHFVLIVGYEKVNDKYNYIFIDPFTDPRQYPDFQNKLWNWLDGGPLGKYTLTKIHLFKGKR